MIKTAQKSFEGQYHGAIYLTTILPLIAKRCAAKPTPLRQLHMEYYHGAFPDASKPS